MTLYRNKYRIESARLKNWDYSSNGYYFITICTRGRINFFGEILDDAMVLNDSGIIVQACWNNLTNHYDNLILDEFIIMPNHIHGIMIIENNNTPGHGISEFVRALKSFSSRRINELNNTPKQTVWQSRFHDRIIRDQNELDNVRRYIRNNPVNWENDDLYGNDVVCANANDDGDDVTMTT